jgi:integrase
MICMIYRRKRTIDGKIEMARLYRGRYRLDGANKITDVPLHTSDKRIAQQNLEKIVKDKQLETAGMAPSEAQRNAVQSPLTHHLKSYLSDLTAIGRDQEYIYIVEKQIQKLLLECKWTTLSNVTSDSFLRWRACQQKAPKTLNEYLASMSSLLNWMERHERIEKNPLKRVQKVQTNGRQVRLRRAFTDDEMKRLLKVAGTRKVVYLMAIYTGLRRGELSKLLRTDLHLDAAQPFINVRASTTKNHKQAILALHPDLVPELNSVLASLPDAYDDHLQGRPESCRDRIYQRPRPASRLPFSAPHPRD